MKWPYYFRGRYFYLKFPSGRKYVVDTMMVQTICDGFLLTGKPLMPQTSCGTITFNFGNVIDAGETLEELIKIVFLDQMENNEKE